MGAAALRRADLHPRRGRRCWSSCTRSTSSSPSRCASSAWCATGWRARRQEAHWRRRSRHRRLGALRHGHHPRRHGRPQVRSEGGWVTLLATGAAGRPLLRRAAPTTAASRACTIVARRDARRPAALRAAPSPSWPSTARPRSCWSSPTAASASTPCCRCSACSRAASGTSCSCSIGLRGLGAVQGRRRAATRSRRKCASDLEQLRRARPAPRRLRASTATRSAPI